MLNIATWGNNSLEGAVSRERYPKTINYRLLRYIKKKFM